MEDFLILYHVFAFVTPVSLSSFGDVLPCHLQPYQNLFLFLPEKTLKLIIFGNHFLHLHLIDLIMLRMSQILH